ncbi:MAG: hypothetical protein L3J75_16315 [Methylococcaceae bacterium]|nr:hypothetical protein [Methylococcaceae bacterium]
MTENTQHVEKAVREAFKSEEDLYQQVKIITLKALTERSLDMENIKSVVQAVSKGISAGISSQSIPAKNMFKQSIDALDDALVKTAEASKLSIEEAASRMSEFSNHDLNRATEDLKSLEEMFLETVGKVARESNEAFVEIVDDFISHAKQNGTSVGKQTQAALEYLNDLRHLEQKTIITNTSAAASTLTTIASGILSGIAESLHSDKDDT